MKRSNAFVEVKDEAKIGNYLCDKCKHSGWFFQQCDDANNIYADRSGANMHKHRYHSLKNHPKKKDDVDEFNERDSEHIKDIF